MEVIQQRDIILRVRDLWNEQYSRYPDSYLIGHPVAEPMGDIRKRLAALNLETCSVADIDAAIGARGWADNRCDECNGNFPVLIHIGDTPDYNNKWQDLCPACLTKAVDLANSTVATP